MDDEGCAVFGEEVFKEPMEKYISVYLLKRFTVIPGVGRMNPWVAPSSRR